MKVCKSCGIPMVGIWAFSKESNEKFNKCPKCYSETRHNKLRDEELDFGEVLNTEIRKIK